MSNVHNGSRESTPLMIDSEEGVSTTSFTIDAETSQQYDVTKIIISLWLGSFLSALDSTVVASTMSGIASEFNNSENLTWIATSYMLTNTAFQPLYGKTSDILGRKFCLVFAQFWFGFGCLLCSFSQNITQFAIARAIAGIGGGGLSSLSSIVVSDIVSLQDRGMYQGYANLMYATAQSLGGPIGGFCLQTIGWRFMFGLQAPLTVLCMVLAVKYVNIYSAHFPKEEERFTKENLGRIDFLGSFCLVISTSSLLFWLSVPTSSSKWGLIITCIGGFVGFLYIENKVAREPVIPPHLFKGVLGLTAFIASFGTFCYFNILFVVPLYLEVIQDVSPSGAGGYIIFQVVPVAFGSLFAGSYLKKLDVQNEEISEDEKNEIIQHKSGKLVIASLLFELVGLIIIQICVSSTSPNSSNLLWKLAVVLGLSSCGFGIGILLVALLVLAVAIVGKEGQAAASSMNYLFRSVGQVLGVSIPLSVYNKRLFKKLASFLNEEPDGDSILKKLLKDNKYLRNGLASELKEKVFHIYRGAISISYFPGGVAATLGLLLALSLLFKKKT